MKKCKMESTFTIKCKIFNRKSCSFPERLSSYLSITTKVKKLVKDIFALRSFKNQ